VKQTPLKRTSPRRSQPRRDWTGARAKVENEACCRRCGGTYRLEAAHVIGREVDRDAAYVVLAVRIVPLCNYCHGAYDRHEIDLLPHLRLEEQIAATRDAGGM
jgi:hypothetical protein